MYRLLILALSLVYTVDITTDKEIDRKLYTHHLMLAQQNDAESMFVLADMYENGRGVDSDYAEAIKWYRLSAKRGNGTALRKLIQVRKKMRAQFDSSTPTAPEP